MLVYKIPILLDLTDGAIPEPRTTYQSKTKTAVTCTFDSRFWNNYFLYSYFVQ